ncbi:MAG: hypothetical protein K2M91_16065, partial [Lachnospiraceae bacterium]|nr:hypothetical protein [Lachnospiraceae bacterium]
MEKKSLSALEVYINKVFVLILILVPATCVLAGIMSTLNKMSGMFAEISWIAFILFDISVLAYLTIGIYFVKTGFSDGIVIDSKLKQSKIFLVVSILIQYNFLSYLSPSKELWAYLFLFAIATAFFLDMRMVVSTVVGLVISLTVACVLNGEKLLPDNLAEMITCIVLTFAYLLIFTYLVKRFLISAKKDEIEKNNERVQNVLNKVTDIASNLGNASQALVETSQAESNSTQELSAISESLLETSAGIIEKSGQSK